MQKESLIPSNKKVMILGSYMNHYFTTFKSLFWGTLKKLEWFSRFFQRFFIIFEALLLIWTGFHNIHFFAWSLKLLLRFWWTKKRGDESQEIIFATLVLKSWGFPWNKKAWGGWNWSFHDINLLLKFLNSWVLLDNNRNDIYISILWLCVIGYIPWGI